MLKLAGGKVKRTPPRVLTPTELDDPRLRDKNIKNFKVPKKTKLEEVIDDAFNKRDKLGADLLDLDDKYKILNDVIKDQIKDMNIPVTNRALREAVRAFGGDGTTITADIYDKAKKTAEAIGTLMGLNPLHLPFAKPTENGKALTQYEGEILKNCSQITENFPNKKIVNQNQTKIQPFIPSSNSLENDGIGTAGTNDDGSLLTTLEDLLNKAKVDLKEFLAYKLFWDIVYHKFLKKIITFPFKNMLRFLEPWKDKRIIGRFIKPFYCLIKKHFVDLFENIPLIFGIRPPPISGNKNLLENTDITNLEYED